jgi:hypothetical protein
MQHALRFSNRKARSNRKEFAMKLNSALLERTANQFGAQTIPETHPAIPQLNSLFGDHTFFLDNNGLHIVEPVEPTPTGARAGKVVKLASWSDPSRTSLAPHEPELTDVTVDLESEH